MNNKVKIGIVVGIILIVTSLLVVVLIRQFKDKILVVDDPALKEEVSNVIQDETSTENVADSFYDTYRISNDKKFNWYVNPKPISLPALFKAEITKFKYGMSISDFRAWEVGSEAESEKGKIILVIGFNGPDISHYVFSDDGYKLQSINRYSSNSFLKTFESDINQELVSEANDYFRINSLEYPGFLLYNDTILEYSDEIFYDGDVPFFYPEKYPESFKKIYTDKIYGDVYRNVKNGSIYLKSLLGSAKVYSLNISDIISETTWNDGSKIDSNFYLGHHGCSRSYASDVTEEVSMDELIPAGKTKKGEIIYELKDKNNKFLREWYDKNIEVLTSAKETDSLSNVISEENIYKDGSWQSEIDITYEEFVGRHLVFFWRDPFGRLLRFINKSYIFDIDCAMGKPVIYLYPEENTEISVKVSPVGGMTVSDPSYNKGWRVLADPDSNLINLADGKKYPYLFWEGNGSEDYEISKNGFVVAKDKLEGFFDEKLIKLGMIKKEINDFKEFWLPEMLRENKPYYFVTFVSRQEINKLAPLEINPQPDVVIRVLMDYQGLNEYKKVPELLIETPIRKGFTAVEWGGFLKR